MNEQNVDHNTSTNPSTSKISVYRTLGEFLLDLLETFIIAIGLFVIIYNYLVQPNSVIGSSMEPNFHDGQYILTDKLSYRLREPERGEVVVFKYPKDESLDYIKRVVALPGERVLIKNNNITIFNDDRPQGFKLNEKYLSDGVQTDGGPVFPEGKETVVPKNTYFVLGDNRSRSSDSRSWGTVPKSDFVGRVIFRYWPFSTFGIIPGVRY